MWLTAIYPIKHAGGLARPGDVFDGDAGLIAMGLARESLVPPPAGAAASSVSGYVAANGMAIMARPFRIGAFSFAGGAITIAAAGTWYVGVEMWSGQVRLLPRLGHRGWVPVACVVASATEVTSIEQIDPVMPPTRIPRTMAKILAGQPIKAIVMGSSLTEGSAATNWAGMVFSGGSTAHYKIPNSTLQNIGLGGTPNQYQFAQLGFASATQGTNYNDGTYPLAITGSKSAPNGRSSVFDGCDLVVIGMLANGGDYRLSCIEPIIRNLRKAGVEVIVATDNAQGPSTTYSTMRAAALYSDGPELMRIADLYGVEVADTAAYVFEAHLRAAGTGIYSDSIHMMSGDPAGPAAVQPANGHEAWARAVRSIVHGSGVVVGPPIVTTRAWDWNGGSLDGVTAYSLAAVSLRDAKLVVTKNTAASSQWGGSMPHVAPVRAGDTVVVSGTATWDTALSAAWRPSIGLQGGGSGWGSNSPALVAPGPFSVTLTASRDALGTASYVLLFANWSDAPLGAEVIFDDLRITVTASDPGSLQNRVPDRESQIKPLPAPRIVTDLRTPGDAFVILPADEHYVRTAQAVRGSLEAHPSGANSFARRFNAQAVGATSDLLVLTAGKSAALSGFGVVGFAMVLYSVAGNEAATYEVYSNNVLQKAVTIPAQTLTREIYHTIYTPTELNNGSAVPISRTIDIRCTSGTIRIAALVALTFDLELLPIEMADRVGTWSAKVSGGGAGMPGYATDTAGSYVVFRAPDDARRLSWICSARPNSKLIDSWSARSQNLAQASSGVSHVRALGNHVGPGDLHYLRCAESLAGGGDGANGYALHVGGMVVVRDR